MQSNVSSPRNLKSTETMALTTESVNLSRLLLEKLVTFIDSEVSKMMKKGEFQFERIMIDNGAAKSPAGISAFMRYCAHTGSIPKIYPSERAFRGIRNGINKSLGRTSIRIPVGNALTIEFSVELVDQKRTHHFRIRAPQVSSV